MRPGAYLAVVAMVATLGWADARAATLYVTNTKSDTISVIDTESFEVLQTIPLGKCKPNRVAFHPDGKTAWVIYDKSHDLGVVDAEAGTLVRRLKIGGNPYNLAFSPDGRFLYVLDWSSETSRDEVIVYDVQMDRVEGRIEVSTWPAHGVFTRDGRTFYVSSETAGNVAAIVPEPAVLQYISATPVNPFAVEGEVVVGAVLPAAVQLYEVPGSAYGYTIVNGNKVLVDVTSRAVVYIAR